MRRLGILVVGSLLVGALGARTWHIPPPRPAHAGIAAPEEKGAARAESTLPAEAIRDDVAVVRRDFIAQSSAYSVAARADADARLTALEKKDGVTLAAFGVEVCRIAALAGDGHTSCDLPDLAAKFNAVPLNLASFGDGLYVVGAGVGHDDLLGARLLAIDGQSIESVRETAASLRGGTPAHRRLAISYVALTPEILYALGATRSPDSASYRFETRDGRTVEAALTAGPPPPEWRWLLSQEKTPWAWQRLDEAFRVRDVPELDAVVVQLRTNEDYRGHSIAEFLRGVEGELKTRKRRNVIVDLRFDDGGDLLKTRDFMTALPARTKGRVFTITGPRTFSAGIASAAYLKQAGGKRTVIVGETAGDGLVYFAEGRPVTLPHSQLKVLPATARHDYRDGCRAFDDCFAAVAQPGRRTGSPPELDAALVRRPIAIESLEPDIPAGWTLDAFMAGRDPALDAIAARVAKSERRSPVHGRKSK